MNKPPEHERSLHELGSSCPIILQDFEKVWLKHTPPSYDLDIRPKFKSFLILFLFCSCMHWLLILNASSNFVIYCLLGNKFKDILQEKMRR